MKDWAKGFYKSKKWKKCRAGFIHHRCGIDGGICQQCEEKPGYIVHHRTHLTPENINDPMVSLNWANLMYVCKDCHEIEHQFCGRKSQEIECSFDENGDPLPPSKKDRILSRDR